MNSGGRRSGRVERICPSLQNVGPSSSSAVRSRLACRRRPTAPSSSGRPNSSRSPCFAKTTPIFVPRVTRRGWVGVSTADERIAPVEAGCRTAVGCPFVVFTMITVQRALWLIRLGTLPRRNSLRPDMPALPTISTSIAWSSDECTIAIAGSSSITTWANPRSPASWDV
jgi:hypothetical protein